MFKERLNELREEREIRKAEFARQIGLDSSTINRYESGEREPDNEKLTRIADYFNVSIDYLLGRTDDKEPFRKKFISSNIMLLKGNLSFQELADDITENLNSIKLENTFSADYLENFANDVRIPPYQYVGLLALYAQVNERFFYQYNNENDLLVAREVYIRERERPVLALRYDLYNFVADPDNEEYIRWVKENLKDRNIHPREILGVDVKSK